MQNCFQFEKQSVLQHGLSVRDHMKQLIQILHSNKCDNNWKLPDWLFQYRENIINSLLPWNVIETYTIYHDFDIYSNMINLSRVCPSCNKEIFYASKDAFNMALKKNSICRSCSTKAQYLKDPLKNKGINNGRYGKSLIEITNNKYGKEIGSQKYQEWYLKLKDCGFKMDALNPSFGKSPPYNSGRSYKGWYKNIFFRSTLELAFLLKYELENNCLPISGDSENFRITYILNGKNRTYVPDFVCTLSNTIYELKASAFVSTNENLAKSSEALKQYLKMNFSYVIITEKDIDNFNCDSFLSKLHYLNDNDIIKLTKKSLSKLNKRLRKNETLD